MSSTINSFFMKNLNFIILFIQIILNSVASAKFFELKTTKFDVKAYVAITIVVTVVTMISWLFLRFSVIEKKINTFIGVLLLGVMIGYIIHTKYVIGKLDDQKLKKICLANLVITLLSLCSSLFLCFQEYQRSNDDQNFEKPPLVEAEDPSDLYTRLFSALEWACSDPKYIYKTAFHANIKVFKDHLLNRDVPANIDLLSTNLLNKLEEAKNLKSSDPFCENAIKEIKFFVNVAKYKKYVNFNAAVYKHFTKDVLDDILEPFKLPIRQYLNETNETDLEDKTKFLDELKVKLKLDGTTS